LIIYNASAKGATGLDQCRFSSKGASINTAPYQSRISIATGFFRRKLLSPQASFAAGATRLQFPERDLNQPNHSWIDLWNSIHFQP
jgi:hypothetical protein